MFKDQIKTIGRMELAQLYFPYILPRSAWQKLKSLLEEDPALQYLVSLKRRSFLPVEVNIIYQHLGHPQNPRKMSVSGDLESIVSERVVNRKPSTLPLTVDLYSSRARFEEVSKSTKYVNNIHYRFYILPFFHSCKYDFGKSIEILEALTLISIYNIYIIYRY